MLRPVHPLKLPAFSCPTGVLPLPRRPKQLERAKVPDFVIRIAQDLRSIGMIARRSTERCPSPFYRQPETM
jgi:hypothetical protein